MSFVNTVDLIGDEALTNSIIDRSITEFADSNLTNLGTHAFGGCSNLTSVDLPALTSAEPYAFQQCGLEVVNLPVLLTVRLYLFSNNKNLKKVRLPAATSVEGNAFTYCSSLSEVDLPAAKNVGFDVFRDCSSLSVLILRSGTVCTTSGTLPNNCPIASGTGYIYVPSALVDSYKAATNWSTYAAQFRALEDYTVDGTTTGELDPTKI